MDGLSIHKSPDGFPGYIVVRHTAGSAAQYVFPFQHIPAEILDRFSGDKEITCTLGQLCKVDGVIVGKDRKSVV